MLITHCKPKPCKAYRKLPVSQFSQGKTCSHCMDPFFITHGFPCKHLYFSVWDWKNKPNEFSEALICTFVYLALVRDYNNKLLTNLTKWSVYLPHWKRLSMYKSCLCHMFISITQLGSFWELGFASIKCH